MKFLHCSDIHVTAPDYFHRTPWSLGWRRMPALAELSLGGRAQLFARAPDTLRTMARDAQALGVDHLIVSGDVTAYALEEEFDGAKAALAPWVDDPKRCTVIPGNHDTYTPGSAKDRRFERRFGHLLKSDVPECAREDGFPFVRLLGDDVAVLGLKSARVPALPGFSFGKVGPAQLDGVDAALADERLSGRAVLVVVHHAPFQADGRPDKVMHGLRDARALLSRLKGPRFAVLHGHIHHRFHHRATPWRPHIIGAGSSTQAGREGYWLITAEGGQVTGVSKRALGGAEV